MTIDNVPMSRAKELDVNKSIFVASKDNYDSRIMLWHNCLGHPNSMYLKWIFPYLFSKCSQAFLFESCELAKKTRSSYPLSNYKLSHLFSMIHMMFKGLVGLKA